MKDCGLPFLNCPRCGLSIRPKASWLAVEYCPRCMGRARIPVKLFSSALPAADLYPEGEVPNVRDEGLTTTIPARAR
jgi:hypothetical protein